MLKRVEKVEMGKRIDITLRGLGARGKAEMHNRFSSLFSVDMFRHFGPRILNLLIKSPFVTRKLSFFNNFVNVKK